MSNHNLHVLVTGGAGYIGSHTCVELLEAGCQVTIVDNLSNSNIQSLKKLAKVTGKQFKFCHTDLRNKQELDEVFSEAKKIDAVIHFAGLKAVAESGEKPLLYYSNNVGGTLNLLQVMEDHNCRSIVFSSSACVYGNEESPISEDAPTHPTNAYGRTKLHIEEMLKDLAHSSPDWKVVILRYFNPVGAHESGDLGETPNGIPNNLVPNLVQVALGKRPHLDLHGTDWGTKDGTGVRDYIHITDLAQGHMAALGGLITGKAFDDTPNVNVFNLGTGKGTSVLELLNTFAKVSKKNITVQAVGRRPGDVATLCADPSKAERVLAWKARYNLEKMLTDVWNFATKK